MKVKTEELSGAALDWAVAKCEGVDPQSFLLAECQRAMDGMGHYYNYSTNWLSGGPIIEREFICLWSEGYEWEAKIQTGAGVWLAEWDSSPLIAAMRCYVASKLGAEVEIPTELTEGESE